MGLSNFSLAIAGDLHGAWSEVDEYVLVKSNPNGVLFVGDLSDGDLSITRTIKKIPINKSVILGNHDHGRDRTGSVLKKQLEILGKTDCSWKLHRWTNPSFSVVGARPCSAGGGFYISREVQSVFGPVSLQQSIDKIVLAGKKASRDYPLIILAHSGPSGLGSEAKSICGRDWKKPSIDWGDKDLSCAIDTLRKIKKPELVVFGHTHHQLRRENGQRQTFLFDSWGTAYMNSACVPRRGIDSKGNYLGHFSWVEFEKNQLVFASHRWYADDARIAYEDVLFKRYE